MCCTCAGLLHEKLTYNSLHGNDEFVKENASCVSKSPNITSMYRCSEAHVLIKDNKVTHRQTPT